jgi:transcriptional regulator with XRE-family HTH domain
MQAAPAERSLSASRIGAHVKTLRMASGTPASRLAKLAGISASLLSRVERGLVSPSVETLDRIAEGLRVPVSRLLSDQGRRMDFCHVPAGRGLTVDRIGDDSDHRYELLGHLLSGNLSPSPTLSLFYPMPSPASRFSIQE